MSDPKQTQTTDWPAAWAHLRTLDGDEWDAKADSLEALLGIGAADSVGHESAQDVGEFSLRADDQRDGLENGRGYSHSNFARHRSGLLPGRGWLMVVVVGWNCVRRE